MTDTTAPQQTIKVPDRYARVGVKYGFDPTALSKQNIIIEAEPGRGKSTLIMSVPRCLVLDFDRAAHNVIAPRATRVPIRTWDEYRQVCDLLVDDAEKDQREYPAIGFDTMDGFLHMLDRHLCDDINEYRRGKGGRILSSIKEFGDQGAGYTKLAEALLTELDILIRAGYNYVINAHMRVKKTIVGDVVITDRRSAMPPIIMTELIRNADVKARMYRAIDDVPIMVTKRIPDGKGGTRAITNDSGKTKPRSTHLLSVYPASAAEERDDDTKRRIPMFHAVMEIPLIHGWDAFEKEYRKAVQAAKNEEQKVQAQALAKGAK